MTIDSSEHIQLQPATVETEALSQKETIDRITSAKTIALVLATDFDTTPLEIPGNEERRPSASTDDSLINISGVPRPLQRFQGKTVTTHVIECAFMSHMNRVFVLIGGVPEERQRLKESIARETDFGDALSFIDFNARAAYRSTIEACSFSLYDIPKGILDYAERALLGTPDADSVMLLSCDQVRIEPSHIKKVCQIFHSDKSLDVVASWIQLYRRTPLLISRRFLEGLTTSKLCKPGPNGIDRPIPSINMKDVVFGDETLAANEIESTKALAFERGITISAREAVRFAHREIAAGDNAGPSPARTPADEKVIEAARRMVARMASWITRLPDNERRKLKSADSWAWRNREDFPLLNKENYRDDLAYLDSAATTQRCFRALSAETTFNEQENANIYRGGYELSKHATKRLDQARETLEHFIGAGRQEVAYTANASAACNIVATAWGNRNVKQNDVIAVALSEHHSNLLPWVALAHRTGALVEYIPLLPNGKLDFPAYERILSKRPKIVCVAGVSNTLGIINPIASLAERAHAAGARFMLDAAQSLPHAPLNVKEIGCDFAAFSAHKMYGPLGIGGLYITPNASREMAPVFVGGGTVSYASVDGYHTRSGAAQYETGTPPISQAIGWEGALEYLSQIGMTNVLDHSESMTKYTVHALHGIESLTIVGDHTGLEGAGGLVSFSLPHVSPARIGAVCGMLKVAIRSGGHCAMPLAASAGLVGTGRASFAVHTTFEDIEALAASVEICSRLYC